MPTATEIPTETVTFNSKSPNLVLTRRQARHVDNGLGGKEVLGFEEWVERQREKNEERELAGLEPLPIEDTPWKVEFHNHIFKTDHPKLVEWLREHRNLNSNAPSGFYEVGRAPDEPRPTLAEQTTAIAEAQGNFDVDALTALLESERDNHNRPAIVQAAEAALRKIAEGPSGLEADADAQSGSPPSTSQN